MKIKIVIFALIGVIFTLSGCKGMPTTTDPGFSLDGSNSLLEEYEARDFVPQVNADGSLTMYSFNNRPVTASVLSNPKPKGAIRPDDEIAVLIKQYEAVLQANPRDFETCIMLAGLYIDRNAPGDADQAIKYSNMAVSMSKDNPHALYARGMAYMIGEKKEDFDKAISDLQGVMKLNLQSVKGVYYLMGGLYARADKIDEAIDAFEKVAIFDPDFADVPEILNTLRARKK